MTGAPIRIVGWSEAHNCWAATRDGEPTFASVGDLGDAINASSTRGNVPIIVAAAVYAQMMNQGDAWLPRPSRVQLRDD